LNASLANRVPDGDPAIESSSGSVNDDNDHHQATRTCWRSTDGTTAFGPVSLVKLLDPFGDPVEDAEQLRTYFAFMPGPGHAGCGWPVSGDVTGLNREAS